MKDIKAPFSKYEVVALNKWQQTDWVHAFTCPHRGDSYHEGEAELVATTRGWICTFCDHTQDYAHDHMLKVPANPMQLLMREEE